MLAYCLEIRRKSRRCPAAGVLPVLIAMPIVDALFVRGETYDFIIIVFKVLLGFFDVAWLFFDLAWVLFKCV